MHGLPAAAAAAAARSILQLMKLSSFSQLSFPQQFKNCCRSVQPAAIKRVFLPSWGDERVLYLITQSIPYCMTMSVTQEDGRKGSWPELRQIPLFTLTVRITTTNLSPGHSEHEAGEWGPRPGLRIVPYTVSLLFCLRARTLYRKDSLYPPGHSVTAAGKKTDILFFTFMGPCIVKCIEE